MVLAKDERELGLRDQGYCIMEQRLYVCTKFGMEKIHYGLNGCKSDTSKM